MKMFKFVAFVLFSALFLMGCQNTVEGVGKDMQNTGRAIQKSANE